jgi:Phage integrase central domain
VKSSVRVKRFGPVLVKRDNVTFEELCRRWLDSRHDVREVTQIGNEYALKPARAQLGQVKVQDLTRSHIESVIRSVRDRGMSHRTVVVMLGAVRQVLAYGITEGMVSVNVAASVKAPRKQHSDTRPVPVWEPTELIAFRAVADQDEWAAAWRLTLCGLRRSEALGMRWEAIDLARGEVAVQAGRVLLDGHRTATEDPKSTASHRTVPVEEMHPGTVALLRSLSARQPLTGLSSVRVPGDRIRSCGPAREANPTRHLLGPARGDVPKGRGSGGAAPQRPPHAGPDDAPSEPSTCRRSGTPGPHRGGPPIHLCATHREGRTYRRERSRSGNCTGDVKLS